jgi:hypothetical protein
MDGFLDIVRPTLSGMTTNVLDNVTFHEGKSVAVDVFDGLNLHLVVLAHTALLFTYPWVLMSLTPLMMTRLSPLKVLP